MAIPTKSGSSYVMKNAGARNTFYSITPLRALQHCRCNAITSMLFASTS